MKGNRKADRQKPENVLQRDQRALEWAFHSVQDLIAILDCQHRIVRVNRADGGTNGPTARAMCRADVLRSHPRHDRTAPLLPPHAHPGRRQGEHTVEVHEDRLGGDFLVTTTPLRDQAGQIVGSVHVARDITAEKKVNEELQQGQKGR